MENDDLPGADGAPTELPVGEAAGVVVATGGTEALDASADEAEETEDGRAAFEIPGGETGAEFEKIFADFDAAVSERNSLKKRIAIGKARVLSRELGMGSTRKLRDRLGVTNHILNAAADNLDVKLTEEEEGVVTQLRDEFMPALEQKYAGKINRRFDLDEKYKMLVLARLLRHVKRDKEWNAIRDQYRLGANFTQWDIDTRTLLTTSLVPSLFPSLTKAADEAAAQVALMEELGATLEETTGKLSAALDENAGLKQQNAELATQLRQTKEQLERQRQELELQIAEERSRVQALMAEAPDVPLAPAGQPVEATVVPAQEPVAAEVLAPAAKELAPGTLPRQAIQGPRNTFRKQIQFGVLQPDGTYVQLETNDIDLARKVADPFLQDRK